MPTDPVGVPVPFADWPVPGSAVGVMPTIQVAFRSRRGFPVPGPPVVGRRSISGRAANWCVRWAAGIDAAPPVAFLRGSGGGVGAIDDHGFAADTPPSRPDRTAPPTHRNDA